MNNPEPAWSLGDEDDFVLEEDETFGIGDIAGAELPPFEPDPTLDETSDVRTTALAGDDPFDLGALPSAAAPSAARFCSRRSMRSR